MAKSPTKATLTKRALTRRRNAARRFAARRKTPLGRLTTDGAITNENIRRRLQWVAHEWKIPADQLPKVARTPTDEFLDFVEKHHVNFDWLLSGDLKGLRDMMHARKTGACTARQLAAKISSLPTDLERIVVREVDRLLAQQAAEEPEPHEAPPPEIA